MDKELVYQDFNDAVNMQPRELEDWLKSDRSKAVGDSDDGSESTGHRSGRKIVTMKRTHESDLSDEQYAWMRKVVGYVNRHTAQKPDGDVSYTAWRYSLMNWGHDPLK